MLGFHGISVTPISALGEAGAPAAAPFVGLGDFSFLSRVRRTTSFYPVNLLENTLATPFRQTDWAAARNRARLSTFLAPVNLCLLGAVAADMPPPWQDWDVPEPPQEDFSFFSTGVPEDAAVAMPAAQSLPAARRAPAKPGQIEAPNLLVTTLAPSPIPPFGKIETSRTRIAARRIGADLQQSLLQTTLAFPFIEANWKKRQEPARPNNPDIPNLLTTTLVGEGTLPFRESNWAKPKTLAGIKDPLFQNISVTILAPTPIPPFGQMDSGSLPRRAARRPPYDAPTLLQTTLAPSEAAPFVQMDWPLPRKAARPAPDQPLNLLETTLAGEQQTPFSEGNWASPQKARKIPGDLNPPNLLANTLIGQGTLPFQNTDWPGAKPRPAAKAPIFPNLLENTLAAPFAQMDWARPIRQVRAIVSQASVDLLTTTLAAVQAPFVNPLPSRRPTAFYPKSYAQNLLTSTLAPAAMPFAFSAWTLPKMQRRGVVQPSAGYAIYATPFAPEMPPPQFLDWDIPEPPELDYSFFSTGVIANAPPPPPAPSTSGPLFMRRPETGRKPYLWKGRPS